ncbi:MAG TPA: flagellar assembly protein FliW [Candidatus Hydrogenedentes bacterium]|nr:flagellar assembly protein FliW [Candidatus Hydrogenedentota bacterium]
MIVKTARFGEITIEPDAVITFAQPIIGFASQLQYLLLPGPTQGPVKWLQSVDTPDLAFLVVDPRALVPDYKVVLSAVELTELGAGSVEELEVYTLLVVPEDPALVRTNLRAPIVVHPKRRLARQVVLDQPDYPIQFFLAQAKKGTEARESSHARADA